METGRSVYDLVLEEGILTQEDLDTILDPKNMIKPVKLDIKARKWTEINPDKHGNILAESLKLYSTGQCPVFQGVFGMGYSKRRALPYVVKLKAFSQNS